MLELSQADADVFNIFMNALGLPKNTDEEKSKRTAAIQQAYKDAAMVPFEIGELAYQIFDLAELASKKVIKILLLMVLLLQSMLVLQ